MKDSPCAATHADHVRQLACSPAPCRSALAASWRRSLVHHTLDPDCGRRPERVDRALLTETLQANDLLLRLAAPLLDRLAAAALDAGGAVMLASAEGMVLEERLHPSDDRAFADAGLRTGTLWSEAVEGTNGIGTCLADRRPIVIWRDQHFHTRNLGLTCISAPVEGPEGGVIGVVDISSCRDDLAEAQARLIALSVQDTATRIAADLFRATHRNARIITFEDEITLGPCLLAVDADDLILGANRAARRVLDLGPDVIARRVPARDVLHPETGRGDLRDAARAELRRALHRADGNMTAAARDLRIGRATLYRKMKALGLTTTRPH